MRALLALIKKDIRTFRADRRAVIVSFAVPAVLAMMFGFVFRGSGGRDIKLHSRIVNLDASPASQRIVEALVAVPLLGAAQATQAEAEKLVRQDDIDLAIVIPESFIAKAKAASGGQGPKPEIRLLAPPTHMMELRIVEGVLGKTLVGVLGTELGAEYVRCATDGVPYTTEQASISGGEPQYDGAAHALAGMGVQFILIGAVDAAVRMLDERQRGLLRRVHAAPIARSTLVLSRLLSGALIALVVLLFLYAFGATPVMNVRIRGSQLGFGLVAATFALMASALGLLIATFGKTPQATRGVGIFIILVATMLSGAWFPAFLFPGWMQTATKFVPSRWAVDGLDDMTYKGLGLESALQPAGVLLLAAVIFGAWAAWRFKWEE